MIPRINIDINKTLEFLAKYAKELSILFLSLILIYMYFGLKNQQTRIDELNTQNVIYKNNLLAMEDSISVFKNRNQELVFSRRALIGDLETISKTNRELREELQKYADRVLSLQSFIILLESRKPTIVYVDSIISPIQDEYTIPWSWVDEYSRITGTSKFRLNDEFSVVGYNVALNYSFSIPMVTGITKTSDDEWRIFVSSQNPNITISDLIGFSVPSSNFASNASKQYRHSKPWGIGFQFGYGATRDGLSPYMGIGLSYNILTF
jgi:hypothetical protein